MASKGWSDQLAGFNWEFNLIQDDKTVNAWCMPGGKVAFYTAILPICKDENGVAVVMGHEVAHAIGQPWTGAHEPGINRTNGDDYVKCCHRPKSFGHQSAIYAGRGNGIKSWDVEISLANMNQRADHIGLIFMAMAGYDPHHAPVFWSAW